MRLQQGCYSRCPGWVRGILLMGALTVLPGAALTLAQPGNNERPAKTSEESGQSALLSVAKENQSVRLFGRVTTLDGQAVEASRVKLISPKLPSEIHALTDANGQYELLFDLERTKLFDILLMVETDDRSLLGYAAPTIGIEFMETGESRIDITLHPPRDVEIAVVDENHFSIPGGTVCLFQAFHLCLGPYTTGKDGSVKVRIPNTDQRWTVFAGKNEVGFSSTDIPAIDEAGTPTALQAVLEPAQPMRIQVRGLDDQPVVGAQVSLGGFYRKGHDNHFPVWKFFDFASEETDDAGEAWLDAFPFGVVSLSCSHPNYETYHWRLNHEKGAEFVHSVSMLEMVTNRCQVVDEMGEPLADAIVDIRAYNVPKFWYKVAYKTDSTGMIEFSVAVGKPYMLTATLDEKGAAAITGFGIKEQLDEEVQKLPLAPMRTISGTLRSEEAGEGVPGQVVYLKQLGAGLDSVRHMRGAESIAVWMRPVITHRAKTDEAGRFQFLVPAGEFNLSLSSGENNSKRFRVLTDDIENLDLTLSSGQD